MKCKDEVAVRLAGQSVGSIVELTLLYKERTNRLGFSAETLFYKSEAQHTEKLAAIAAVLARYVQEDEKLIDVGCGYGSLLEVYHSPAHYTGIDAVSEFTLEAQRRFPEHTFALGDATELLWTGDWVVLAGVLSSVPAPLNLLKTCLYRATHGVVFDTTVKNRLPTEFASLNRFDRDDVADVVTAAKMRLTNEIDTGRSWMIYVAQRSDS